MKSILILPSLSLQNYSMSVYLVRQLTSAMLLQRLKMKGIRNPDHSRALSKSNECACSCFLRVVGGSLELVTLRGFAALKRESVPRLPKVAFAVAEALCQ